MADDNETEWEAWSEDRCFMYRLTLTDKNGTPFSLTEPERFLSTKAIERRHRQGFEVDSTDLPVSPLYLRQLTEQGVSVVAVSKWNNTVLVRGNNQQRLMRLQHLPFVKDARRVWTSPDSLKRPKRMTFHTEFNSWETIQDKPYGVTQPQIESLNGITLHECGFRGKGMTIAIFDGGYMNADKIPAFRDIKILGTRDFVIGMDGKAPSPTQLYKELDHGTKVLSALAVNVPNIFMGTAPEASYWLLRCEDSGTESQAEEDYWAAAAEFADSVGVDIISSSLGYHHFDDKKTNHRYAELDGQTALISHSASMLAQKGMILINSAGNDGMGIWKKINFPADADDILTVGAVTPEGLNAAFCSVGPTADGRIKPDVMAYGSPTTVITGRGTIVREIGTSFSTPLIAGLVACLWQGLPQLSASGIIELVRKAGSNALTPDNIMGYGIPDFMKAYRMGKTKATELNVGTSYVIRTE